MNLNQKHARNTGIALIVIGLIAVFHLWWAVPTALLAAGGVAIYRRQKALGRTGEAVQSALWGLGLAALMLAHFLLPGVLLLGGTSLLMRGHEAEVEAHALALVGRFSRRRAPLAPTMSTQRITISEAREATSGSETVRLS